MESFSNAVQDFRRARSRAAMQELLNRLKGKKNELLSYEDVRQKLHASGIISRRLEDIPLDRIVGSVGRYNDFNRDFLPLVDGDAERWAKVKVAVSDAAGVPPVEVYQIGEGYFVQDGHHRVSVARELGATSIEAFVTEVRTRVPLAAGDDLDDLLIKAEYSAFLEQTDIDELRPGVDLMVTCPGQYRKLFQHIEVHRYYMGVEEQREIPYPEAVAHWYDTVYRPVVDLIREFGILDEYPHRTEADLYLWIGDHQAELEKELHWDIQLSQAAADIAARQPTAVADLLGRLARLVGVGGVVRVDDVEAQPGVAVRERLVKRDDERLFTNVLVALDGRDSGWQALEEAIIVAAREGGRLRGLHVVATEAAVDSVEVQAIRDRFNWRLGETGLNGQFTVGVGSAGKVTCARARFADLVVASLSYPPVALGPARLGSGYRHLIRNCWRPVMATPPGESQLRRPLLAFDATPKGREALYVAAYIASSWQLSLAVVHVAEDPKVGQETLAEAQRYLLDCDIDATYGLLSGPIAPALIEAAAAESSDAIVMGGYRASVVSELVRPTVVDQVLYDTRVPVIICT